MICCPKLGGTPVGLRPPSVPPNFDIGQGAFVKRSVTVRVLSLSHLNWVKKPFFKER